MRLLLAGKGGILSTLRHTLSLQLRFLVVLPVSVGVQKVVEQIPCFEIVLDSKFDEVAALMA